MPSKQFGGKLTDQWLGRYQSSPNWKDGAFKNLVDTQAAVNWRQLPGIICKQIKGHKQGYPASPLPVKPFDHAQFSQGSDTAKFVWYGHSVVLMRLHGKNILIDPMLGPDASPIAPTKTRRFSANSLDIIDDLPEIDLLLITHDHYDHLDLASIGKLKSKVKQYFVALGVKRHLISWGVEEQIIEEFDWWDSRNFEEINITFTPTRHFSGRGLSSMAKCLWGGWAFKTPRENIWFSGDGGYANHFIEIGQRLGPFDLAFMECGQYSVDWPQIHMFPEESVKAAIDARVKVAMPVHWAGFNLSYHHAWYEPAADFVESAQGHKLTCITPRIGEIFDVNSHTEHWWLKHS
ncbi:MAG: MBL fold metallo-hydrolase [Saprospiraceae bacterium]|nr:MBL fold metallo-hydrolase [Saprospiraceae bacterium]MCB9345720.1 MBL fold metallo-hydrolase [Lewinellaceae bacterium]